MFKAVLLVLRAHLSQRSEIPDAPGQSTRYPDLEASPLTRSFGGNGGRKLKFYGATTREPEKIHCKTETVGRVTKQSLLNGKWTRN
jgi:hypothetical protein